MKDKERSEPRNGIAPELAISMKELSDNNYDAETVVSMDSSRTSDILMETARDYREVSYTALRAFRFVPDVLNQCCRSLRSARNDNPSETVERQLSR